MTRDQAKLYWVAGAFSSLNVKKCALASDLI